MTNIAPRRIVRGTIYVVASDCGLLKIGMAMDAAMRLRGLQGGSPVRLTVLAVKRSKRPSGEEADLHRRFDRYRRHGEWFEDVPEIREWLRTGFGRDDQLTEIVQRASDAVWRRVGARLPTGDRKAIMARAEAFARLVA